MTDFRALCAELVDLLDCFGSTFNIPIETSVVARARAALAQPEPQGPSKHELFGLLMQAGGATQCVSVEWLEPFADAALARYGRPAIEPVPVSERWPEFSDCNSFEEVWAFNPVLDHWKLTRINRSIHTHWLPHWALPVPATVNTINQED